MLCCGEVKKSEKGKGAKKVLNAHHGTSRLTDGRVASTTLFSRTKAGLKGSIILFDTQSTSESAKDLDFETILKNSCASISS